MRMSRNQLMGLARLGAANRIKQMREEERFIRNEFPDLRFRSRRNPITDAATTEVSTEHAGASKVTEPAPRKRRKMSATARQAVSNWMTKWWASPAGRRKRREMAAARKN